MPTGAALADSVGVSSPAVGGLDCVLPLRRRDGSVVGPWVRRFAGNHPEVTSCRSLLDLVQRYESPLEFHRKALRMDSPGKANALVGVLEYLIDIQSRFDEASEQERLEAWAKWTRPADYITVDVRGFALAGFQYLRMLFGAETVKPDAHILRYAELVLDRSIRGNHRAQMAVIYAYESAAEKLGRSARQIDVAIWEHQSGRTHPGRSS